LATDLLPFIRRAIQAHVIKESMATDKDAEVEKND
jgi:hypothetical protein